MVNSLDKKVGRLNLIGLHTERHKDNIEQALSIKDFIDHSLQFLKAAMLDMAEVFDPLDWHNGGGGFFILSPLGKDLE